MSNVQSKSPLTVFCNLETVPALDQELLDAMVKSASLFKSRPGFVSQEIYKCPEGTGYTSILKWASQADHEASAQDPAMASCPVGALIEAGKVRFNMVVNQPVHSSGN